MTRREHIESAVRRANARRAISDALSELPPTDRIEVVLQVLADVDPSTLQALSSTRSGGEQTDGSKGRTSMVWEALRREPGKPIEELAVIAYGDKTTASRSKVRSILASLQKQSRVKKMGGRRKGRWRVVEPK